jgi:hypothetical protein
LRQIIRFVPLLFAVYSFYDFIISPADKFSYKPLAGECLILMAYIIYFFYEKIQIVTSTPIYQTKIFWIAVAFIIYCSGNFFLFLYSNNPVKDDEFFFYYTIIYSTFAILKNIALCTGILINQPNESTDRHDFVTQKSFLEASGFEKNDF